MTEKNATDGKPKRVNLREIARLAGTSKSTVSRVLTKHPNVSPRTRDLVEAVIKQYSFRPNLFARGLAGGKTGLIAVLASEMNSGFFAEVIKGIDHVSKEHDVHILSSFAHGADDFIRLWREFDESSRVDGIVLIAPPLEIFLHGLRPDHVPLALCSCRPAHSENGWQRIDTVTMNNRNGFHMLLSHLRVQGRRRFLHVAGPVDVYDANERKQVFLDYMKENGPQVQGDVLETSQTMEGGRDTLQRYLSRHRERPDAVVAVNDLAALGALQALQMAGIRVPEEMAVTGCDDDDASSLLGLTTLHMPMVNLGNETAKLLFERIDKTAVSDEPQHKALDFTLMTRRTS